MCRHTNTVKMGEAKVCLQCGLTIINGKPFYDKDIVNYNSKKERRKAEKKYGKES